MRVLILISLAFVLVPIVYSNVIEAEIYGDFWPGGGPRTRYSTKRNFEGDSVYHGPYQRFYETGELAEQGLYKDGKREGDWQWYFENGREKARCSYKQDEGSYVQFYESGEKQLEGTLVGTNREGMWIEWYPNGTKRMEGAFRAGKQHGKWSYWDETTGRLLRTMLWEDGDPM